MPECCGSIPVGGALPACAFSWLDGGLGSAVSEGVSLQGVRFRFTIKSIRDRCLVLPMRLEPVARLLAPLDFFVAGLGAGGSGPVAGWVGGFRWLRGRLAALPSSGRVLASTGASASVSMGVAGLFPPGGRSCTSSGWRYVHASSRGGDGMFSGSIGSISKASGHCPKSEGLPEARA